MWFLAFTLWSCAVSPPPAERAGSPDGVAPVAQAAPVTSEAAPAATSDDPRAALAARPLALTRHGACRMDCRQIDRGEVDGVLRSGVWAPERTRSDGPCPSHAFEGRGTDGHRLRVVFAACPDETRVVTAIDLDRDWPCACD